MLAVLTSPRLLLHRLQRTRRAELAGILPGEQVGHDDLVTTARTYTHVVADEAEVSYDVALRA